MKTPTDSRDRVLGAASAIVARQGAGNLTIDAVAAESGLSKGGVLYHFPNKHALLGGMLSRLMEEFETKSADLKARTGVSELIAHLQALLERSAEERATSQALLANSAEDPSLLAPAKPFLNDMLLRIADESSDSQLALILWLAAEGIRFMDMLDILPAQTLNEHHVSERMLELAEEVRA